VELLDLEVASDRVGLGLGDVGERLRPAHVGVPDAGVDQHDAAAVAADRDRFGVLGLGGAHEVVGAVEGVAINGDEQHVPFDRGDEVATGSPPRSVVTSRSPCRPCLRRPRRSCQPSASAGLQVAIWHSSRSEKARSRRARFHRCATLSSPSRFFDPDGDQSAPRQIRIPLSLAATTSVVSRYSHRFENGDQITEPPRGAHSA
jgi:hypothetical protein